MGLGYYFKGNPQKGASMRLWVPLTVGCVIVAAYAYLYQLTLLEAQGAAAVGMANLAGLLLVFVGIVLAGLILRRASPPK